MSTNTNNNEIIKFKADISKDIDECINNPIKSDKLNKSISKVMAYYYKQKEICDQFQSDDDDDDLELDFSGDTDLWNKKLLGIDDLPSEDENIYFSKNGFKPPINKKLLKTNAFSSSDDVLSSDEEDFFSYTQTQHSQHSQRSQHSQYSNETTSIDPIIYTNPIKFKELNLSSEIEFGASNTTGISFDYDDPTF